MRLIDATNAADYLRESGRIGPNEQPQVRELAGGVSNIVLLVQFPSDANASGQNDFVLKQARGQLRVADPWFCSVERIRREVEVLRVCEDLLSRSAPRNVHEHFTTPRVLFEDADNYLFAMDAAPQHEVWKTLLLRGECDSGIAKSCGKLLGTLHSMSWNDRSLAAQLGDRQFFDDLRVDPYYRQIARVHPPLERPIGNLIDALDTSRHALVHGDFSPKNLLVYGDGLMLVDCEVGHFGDPAFDLGFFLTHLCLKGVRVSSQRVHNPIEVNPFVGLVDSFWDAYRTSMLEKLDVTEWSALEQRAVFNLTACMLARIDGKSKVEYLAEEERERVRRFCLDRLPRLAAASPIGESVSAVARSVCAG